MFYARIVYIVSCLFLVGTYRVAAQSPDSRICTCFSEAVSNDVMFSTKAIYGRIGIAISRDMVLTPNYGQAVRFVMPTLPLKAGCQPQYSMAVVNQDNQVVFSRTTNASEIVFTFSTFKETYKVTIVASAKSSIGPAGNCSRSLRFSVNPTVPRI